MNRSLLKTIVFTILLSVCIQAQWAKAGFTGRSVQDIAAKDSLLYALSYDGFFSSKDNGATWDSLSSFGALRPQHILFLNDTIFVYANWAVVAEDAMQDSPCVFRSDDGGHTWKTILSSFMGAGSMAVIGSTIFCTVDPKHLLKSTNYGASWDTLAFNPPSLGQIDHLFSFNKNLYAAQANSRLFRSSDDGLNWKDISGSIQPLGYYSMFSGSKYIFLEADSILYRSSDEGESWKKLQIPLTPSISVFCAAVTDTMIFLSGHDKSMYTTKVYAGTIKDNKWKDISAGLPVDVTFYSNASTVKGSWLFLAASRELWKYDLSKPLSVEDDAEPVKTFCLSQNYPNPFNPATTISYTIPKSSFVELKVFDMLGREIQTLVSKEQNAGDYKVQFNASGIPSGMYIYKIRANEFTMSGKMLLLK